MWFVVDYSDARTTQGICKSIGCAELGIYMYCTDEGQ